MNVNKNNSISIILPVFNEGGNIKLQIAAIQSTTKNINEILVVYDFDKDNTIPEVKKMQKKYTNIKLTKNLFGMGVISAIKTGIIKAKGEFIVIMPADLADDANTINKMKAKMGSKFDIIGATRYTKGGKKMGGDLIKTFFSRFAGIATPFLLGIPVTDISNGFKMYRKKVLNEIVITADGGWEFSIELIIKAYYAGFKISEVSTIWKDRISGASKFNLKKWLPKYFKWYFWGIKKRFII